MLTHIADYMTQARLPDNLICDHVCYRVETMARYNDLKEYWARQGKLEAESMIAGRPICIFSLYTLLRFRQYEISCVELPAPKEGSFYPEGWEHAEFVIAENFDDFMNAHPHLAFDTKDSDKKSNPDISLDAGLGFRIKFHHAHILDVIAREREVGII